MITLTFVQKVLVGSAVAVLLLMLWLGLLRGRYMAQADYVLHEVSVTQQGLNYFYNDQGRFPTTVEFADQATMVRYFSTTGVAEPAIHGCASPLVRYASDSQKTYQLEFCLPVARGQYSAGISRINERVQ